MNRNEEYRALLAELEDLPERLDRTEQRALLRRESARKRRRWFGVPAVGMAACFGAFVLLVNLSVPFARACGSVPLVRELAKAVAWSPSLSAAVENAYVQPIGQSQTVNGITATVEYVIVDQKQLNIFYTLHSDAYDNFSTELPVFSEKQVQCHRLCFPQAAGDLAVLYNGLSGWGRAGQPDDDLWCYNLGRTQLH